MSRSRTALWTAVQPSALRFAGKCSGTGIAWLVKISASRVKLQDVILFANCATCGIIRLQAREGAGEAKARPAAAVHSEGMTSFHPSELITSWSAHARATRLPPPLPPLPPDPPLPPTTEVHVTRTISNSISTPQDAAQLSKYASLRDCKTAVHLFRRIFQSTEDFMDYPDLSPSRAR